MSQNVRAWIYRIATAGVPLLVFYGVVADKAAPLWVAFAAAVTGTGIATVHTPTKKKAQP